MFECEKSSNKKNRIVSDSVHIQIFGGGIALRSSIFSGRPSQGFIACWPRQRTGQSEPNRPSRPAPASNDPHESAEAGAHPPTVRSFNPEEPRIKEPNCPHILFINKEFVKWCPNRRPDVFNPRLGSDFEIPTKSPRAEECHAEEQGEDFAPHQPSCCCHRCAVSEQLRARSLSVIWFDAKLRRLCETRTH
jgi:hypothetical protein